MAKLTSPSGLLVDEDVVVVVVVAVVSADNVSRLLEFASLDVSTFCRRRRAGLLRKELDNGVRGMVRGAIRDVGVPGTDAVTFDCGGGGGGGGTDGNRGGGNGRV